jgi:hypothetical protein
MKKARYIFSSFVLHPSSFFLSWGREFMVELKVVLDFACCACEGSVSATVVCSGKGLAAEERPVAAVTVPCPSCGSVNHVCFEPNGTIRDVGPYQSPRRVPEPSVN